MPDTSEKHMLRFGCPECGTRLVVDPSLAGKEGPCPTCGEIIIAPPIAAATSLVAKAGAPVEIKPREVGRKGAEKLSTATDEDLASEAPLSEAVPGATSERRRGRRRSGVVSSELGGATAAGGGDPTGIPTANQMSNSGVRKVRADTGISQKASESKDVKTLMLMVLITCIVVCIALGVYYYMTIGE